MRIEPTTNADWSPKHPYGKDCKCNACSVMRFKGAMLIAALLIERDSDRQEAVPSERHGDPFEVEVPAVALLEDCGAIARRHLFA